MDTGIAREGDSPLFDVRERSFWITLGYASLPEFNLYRIPKMLPNHLKRFISDLPRQVSRDLLGGMEHAAGGPRGHHLTREPHRSRNSRLAGRERRRQDGMGRSSHPHVPTTLPAYLG
jgi:hypothetical protein